MQRSRLKMIGRPRTHFNLEVFLGNIPEMGLLGQIATFLFALTCCAAQEHSVVYVGTDRGLFRTMDGGNTWRGSEGLGAREVLAVAIGPGRLFAAATDGLFRSDDGENWLLTDLNASIRPRVILLDPANPDRVYAAGNGLWVSDDGGSRWTEVAGLPSPVTDLVADPDDPSTLYAATPTGVYRSDDRGNDWVLLPQPSAGERLAIAPSKPSRLYVGGKQGLLSSSDKGATWELVDTQVLDVAWYAMGLSAWGGLDVIVSIKSVQALVVDPIRSSLRYAAITGCLSVPPSVSEAGCTAAAFSRVSTVINGTVIEGWTLYSFMATEALEIDPLSGATYAGGSSGLFRSDDGRSWMPIKNLGGRRVHSIAIDAGRTMRSGDEIRSRRVPALAANH